jgi:hypothetical protein
MINEEIDEKLNPDMYDTSKLLDVLQKRINIFLQNERKHPWATREIISELRRRGQIYDAARVAMARLVSDFFLQALL